jgi:tektin-1
VEVNAAIHADQDQANKTRAEIALQQRNINALRDALSGKTAPLQLATTRLATRAGRPGIERTSDAAHHSLVDEATHLDVAIGAVLVAALPLHTLHREIATC